MKKELFRELLESIREAGAIARGELAPARVTRFPAVDTRAIRQSIGATQLEFSRMIGVSLATLRNWEQGRRMPHGPARVLLLVAKKDPSVVRDVIRAYRVSADMNAVDSNVLKFETMEPLTRGKANYSGRGYQRAAPVNPSKLREASDEPASGTA